MSCLSVLRINIGKSYRWGALLVILQYMLIHTASECVVLFFLGAQVVTSFILLLNVTLTLTDLLGKSTFARHLELGFGV